METIVTKCPICGSNDLEFEDNSVGCRACMKVIFEYEDEVLELIDNQDEFTRSDLQDIVYALVLKILKKGGEKNETNDKSTRKKICSSR